MKHLSSNGHERENTFGRSCVRLRKTMKLTQRELGRLLGISEQTIQYWERGVYSPTPEHLERLLILCIQQHVFASGHEHEEAEQLWLAAGRKADFDASWMRVQFTAPSAPVVLNQGVAQTVEPLASQEPLPTPSRFDWGEALDVHNFYGRQAERIQLEQWVIEERAQVISVLGMGGIGKSALAVTFMYQAAPAFQSGVFRSVRDAPSCQDLLVDCLQALSPQPLSAIPGNIDQCIDLLLECFQTQRCLLVLDNLEALLQEHDQEGRYRPGYEDYAMLLRRVAETPHQSCMLITSREIPTNLGQLEGRLTSLRTQRLAGLESDACEQLLEEREAVGATQDRERLIQMYAGNPLALKIVSEIIAELFGGEISAFLEQGGMIFSNIRDLLTEQYARLSALEQALLTWLVVVREPVYVDELLTMLIPPIPRERVREVLEALQRRSLIEQGKQQATFTLQSVVMEYVTEVLVERVSEQIQSEVLDHLIRYALAQAGAKEYVRQTQERLIVAPIIQYLHIVYRDTEVVAEHLLELLNQLRTWEQEAQGYGPANLITLLRGLRGHLRNLDLSHLAIRGAYMQGVEMQDTSLADATLSDTIFTEALDATWSVAISGDGTFWAAGSRRGEIRVWREGGQTLHLVWQAHTDNTYALAFSPDGRTLASGSWDGTVKLWELEHGALLWTGWHTNSVDCVAFAPDGHILASGGDDAIVHLWDVISGTNVQTLAGHGSAVYAMAWNPDGSLFACGGFDGSIRLWQLQGTQPATCVQTLTGHTNWVMRLAFASDGKTLISASWDQTIKLWDVANGSLRRTLTGHTDRVRDVAWSPDGHTVASSGCDKTIRLWDIERGNCRSVLHGHTADVYSLAFTPDSRSLLSGSEDSTLRVWDVESGQCVRILQGYAVSFYDIDWSPDGTQLASAGTDTFVTIWDVTGTMQPRMLSGHRWIVHGIAWSPNGQLLASGGWDNAIRLWDVSTGTSLRLLRDPDYVDNIFQGVAWSPDGRLLACGSYMHGVQVWDMTTYTRRWVGLTHTTKIRRVSWSPSSTRLACCGDDGNVYLWDASDGTLLQTLKGHSGMVASVAWNPNGTRLISGAGGRGSGELFVWDAQSGERLQTVPGHDGIVFAVAWSKQGDLLVSGGSDGILRWWDMQSGTCLAKREAHDGWVQSLKISPDGRLLASSGDDSTIRLWDLESAEPQGTLRRDRPYERLNITGTRGLTDAQKITLYSLGAIEEKTTTFSNFSTK